MREVANQPAQSQLQSQKLRDIARSLQENATPERREQLQRLAEQYAQREHGNENQQPQSQHGADPQNSQQSQYFPRGGESPDAKDNASDAGRAGNQTGGTPNPAAPSPSTARGTERTGIAPGSSTAGLRSGSPMGKASTPERDASDRTVDARSNAPVNPRERVIAEWYSNMPPDASARQSGSPAPTEELRRAAEAVDRAIEQQTIPPRYSDLVRRVFKRYAEQTAPPASREGTPPTTSKP